MKNSGQYNFRKPIDKTPAEYAPIKVSYKKKVNLSDLPIKEEKKYSLLLAVLCAYGLVLLLGIWFFYGVAKTIWELIK